MSIGFSVVILQERKADHPIFTMLFPFASTKLKKKKFLVDIFRMIMIFPLVWETIKDREARLLVNIYDEKNYQLCLVELYYQ